ncbi:MAG: hypothetical protein JOZ05_17680 [Acetobacteraceae bacterium]|nr:hypothetical protein [Acetobacteraceae bacterium]
MAHVSPHLLPLLRAPHRASVDIEEGRERDDLAALKGILGALAISVAIWAVVLFVILRS